MPIHGLHQGRQQYVHTTKKTDQIDLNLFIPPPGSAHGTPASCGRFGAPQGAAIEDLADVAADTVDKPWKISRKMAK